MIQQRHNNVYQEIQRVWWQWIWNWKHPSQKSRAQENKNFMLLYWQSCSVQFSSVTQSCPTHCDAMDCSTVGLPIHNQLPEFTQTHVLWVGDAIPPPHPLLSPFPPLFNLSQHQGLFKWVSSLHQVTKGLELQLQHQSFQWIFRTDFLVGQTGWNSLKSKGLLVVFSNTTVQKYQFFGTHLSLQFNSYIHTWLFKKPQLWLDGPLLAK